MRTQSAATRSTAHGTGTTGLRCTGVVALTVLLLAGCSAGGGSADSTVRQDQAAGGQQQAGSADGGGSGSGADTGSGTGPGTGSAGAVDADAGGRQVITTGEVTLVAPDPRAAADAVVDAVEGAGGRVDARQETAADPAGTGTGTGSDDGSEADPAVPTSDGSSAALTVRVPAEEMTATLDALDEIGEVDRLDLRSDDVTGTAQDLDARIRAARVSVTRLEDLLARAATTADVIAAEETLAQRQSSLEQLESERARLGEQVALSTLTITITATPPDPVSPAEARGGFLGGLGSGWSALVTVLGVSVVVLGTLLPWLALAAVLGLGYVAVRGWVRRRRASS
ncbi:MAG TPA: DUF4349 domain-containing protein, partial [Cellulomonas sp.]